MTAATTLLAVLAISTLLVLADQSRAATSSAQAKTTPKSDCIILLHGLARTSLSMKAVEWHLKRHGYHVINARYPTSALSIAQIATTYLAPLLQADTVRSATSVSFVTHSQGGILLRQYFSDHDLPNLGRVVMLAPPNHGSELIDRLQTNRFSRAFVGAGYGELGAGPDSLPNRLGRVRFDCGIIAGDSPINPILARLLPGPSDGKVTVASTKVEGMNDFLIVHQSHTWLMWRKDTLLQIERYLSTGHFDHLSKPVPFGD
jgi:triacylglycerol lipase